MITGIDINAITDFTCADDKDQPTVWKIGVLSSCAAAQMSQMAAQEEYIDAMFKVFRLCVKGWDNFNIEYKTDTAVIFGKKVDSVSMDIVDRIPMKVIMEVASKIMEMSNLSAGEQKN